MEHWLRRDGNLCLNKGKNWETLPANLPDTLDSLDSSPDGYYRKKPCWEPSMANIKQSMALKQKHARNFLHCSCHVFPPQIPNIFNLAVPLKSNGLSMKQVRRTLYIRTQQAMMKLLKYVHPHLVVLFQTIRAVCSSYLSSVLSLEARIGF